MAIPFTASQAKTNLYNENRDYYNRKTWENLLSQQEQSAIAAENQLVKDYTQASTAAYTSYLQNRANIETSALFGESKQKMLSENQLNLEEAYNTYRQNLAQNEQAVQKSYQEGVSAVDKALEKQAEYTAQYESSHYGYLQDLVKQNPWLLNNADFSRYVTKDILRNEETGEYLVDESGQYQYDEPRLKSMQELYYGADGLLTPILDENGNKTGQYELTPEGADFYDMVENLVASGSIEGITGAKSWQQYLEETNPELAEWARSYNPYDYTKVGTNEGTFKTLTGRSSTDFDWSPLERINKNAATQLKTAFSNIENALNKDTANIEDWSNTIGDLSKVISQDQLQDILTESGINASEEVAALSDLLSGYEDKSTIDKKASKLMQQYQEETRQQKMTNVGIGVDPRRVNKLTDAELAQIKERAYKEAREHNANIKSQFKTKFANLISRINSSISEREKESEKDFYKSSKLY